MNAWKRYERSLHHAGPYWCRVFGDNFTGTVFEEPNAEGRFAWYVADGQQAGAKTFRQGLSSSIDEAKFSADAAVLDRRRGRSASVQGELMTSTDRNRRRIDRLLAAESQARGLVNDLVIYHRDLVMTGDAKTANRIRQFLRRAALSGLSDYIRRTAQFRVCSGQRLPTAEEMRAHEKAVLEIADELDALADDPAAVFDAFETVANKLRQKGSFPDSEFYSAVAQSFLLNEVVT